LYPTLRSAGESEVNNSPIQGIREHPIIYTSDLVVNSSAQ
jgi:hypothetical protein